MNNILQTTNLSNFIKCGLTSEFEKCEEERFNKFIKLAKDNSIELKIGKRHGYDSVKKTETEEFSILFDENAKKVFMLMGVRENSFPDLEQNLIGKNIILSTDNGAYSIYICGGHFDETLDNWMSLSSLSIAS